MKVVNAEGMDIINISDYGEALRNSGYKDIESAMAEIVDNSIQAEADNVLVIIKDRVPACEISFERDLDQVFKVANNKQHVELIKLDGADYEEEEFKPVWLQLEKIITDKISEMQKRKASDGRIYTGGLEGLEALNIFKDLKSNVYRYREICSGIFVRQFRPISGQFLQNLLLLYYKSVLRDLCFDKIISTKETKDNFLDPEYQEDKSMNYIIVDFEMNPVASEYKEKRQISRSEIIEIGAVIMDDSLLVLGEFKTLVKPQYNDSISKRYEALTGISTQMVCGAPTFATAYEMFVNWCESYGSEYEVYAWSENDYKQLVAEMKLKNYSREEMMGPLRKWFDFQKEYTKKLGLERIMSLEKALNYAGITFEGHMHDALCDAKNTAELFAIVRDKERCNVVLKAVMDVLKPKKMNSTLGEMFNFSALMAQLDNEIYKG